MACDISEKQPNEYGDSIWESTFRNKLSYTYEDSAACRAAHIKANGSDKTAEIRDYLWSRLQKLMATRGGQCGDVLAPYTGLHGTDPRLVTAFRTYFPGAYAEYVRLRAMGKRCEANAYFSRLPTPGKGAVTVPLAVPAARPGDAMRGPGNSRPAITGPAPTLQYGGASGSHCQYGSYASETGQVICRPPPSGTTLTSGVSQEAQLSPSSLLLSQTAPRDAPLSRPLPYPPASGAFGGVGIRSKLRYVTGA